MQKLSHEQFMELAKTQIGCGYCSNTNDCAKYDPKINNAKLGCDRYEHYYLKIHNIDTKTHQK